MTSHERLHMIWLLLDCKEKLIGFPHLDGLKKEIDDALSAYNKPEQPSDLFATRVFPEEAGVVETNTEHKTPEMERRV